MSFFPSEAEQIQFIAEAESVTPSAFSMFISQDDIDHILRAGGNADAARMKIAAEFSKQKPLEDRAAFLKNLYYGGNGLITDNGRLSAWYGDDGIHIATGDAARHLRSVQVISWADAAERVEALLDGGAFATNLEVTEAPRYERLGIAVDVWNLYHDFSDEAKSLGYLSCLGNIHSTSFPEETERLTDDLLNPAFRESLLSEYKVFMDAYRENRALLRFHYHKSQALLTRLEDLSLPRKEFRSDMEAIPETGRFITEDEIAASLANGSSFEGGKTRIYAFFQTSHTPKENADFLKKEYGIGGHTHAVSRESGSYEDHGNKGITLKKAGCADVQMNWNKVASRISELIRMNRYFTPDEQALYDKAQAQDVVRNTAYDSYNAIKEAHPDDIVLYQVGDFFEIYGEDARQAAELLDMFCDISTPKTTPSQRAAKASPGTLDSPEIHALESAISLEESAETPFTVYEDVRQKLIDAGMPPEQIAFIHDANTEVKKRELFAKVRSGQVRVLMGSTAKMGAGTNVQDRLVALHDLDCPWRPRDLTQRKGRIERQGNQNKLVHVCRYVTEGTFDAYLWQTVENKQKFISQIMTSKSPVRSCEDVDATALSFAEIKALCAGDPRIKERMDLDIEVSKLKIMKADHNSKQFRLEDSLLKYFPEKIEEHKGFVRGLETDMQTLAAHPLPTEGFVGMEIRGDRLTDKENAGAALLDTCKEVKGKDPVQIGSYRGFTMSVAFDSMWKTYTLTLKGQMTHRVELGSDARGNLVRIENALDKMPERLRSVQDQLENLYNQQAAAKAEVGKPFPQEQELTAKTARLIELDMELNLDGKGQPQPEQAIAKSTRPSVLDRLKAPPVHGTPEKPHKKEMEAR